MAPRSIAVPTQQAKPAQDDGGLSVGELWRKATLFLRRQWPLLLSGVVLGAALVPLALFFAPPSYQATARLMLDTTRMQVFSEQGAVGDTPIESSAAVESQIEVMRSDRVARRVIKALNLEQDPAFQVTTQTRASRVLGPEVAEMIGRSPIRSPEQIERYRIDLLQTKVDVRRIPGTFAVDIAGRADTPAGAAAMANTVAKAYLAENVERKQDLSGRAIDWMGERIDEVRKKLESAQKELAAFQSANNLSSVDVDRLSDTRIRDMESQIASANATAMDAKARYDRIAKATQSSDPKQIQPFIPSNDGGPTVRVAMGNSAAFTRLWENYRDLDARYQDWSKQYGKTHEATRKLGVRVQAAQAAVVDETKRLANSYRDDYEIAKNRADQLEKTLSALLEEKHRVAGVRLKLNELDSAVQTHQRNLAAIASRQAATSEQQTFPIPRAWLLNDAIEPSNKTLKRTTQSAAVLFGLGAALGLLGALLRELGDRSFRRLDEVQAVFPTAVGRFVPRAGRYFAFWSKKPKTEKSEKIKKNETYLQSSGRQTVRSNALFWTMIDDPKSLFAHSIRSARHDIERFIGKAGHQVVGVTGADRGAGVSTTAAAVALALASSGAKTLLLDCNLKDPALSAWLAPQAAHGLLDVINGVTPFVDAFHTEPTSGLHFLPLGVRNDIIEDEVMTSSRLADFIKKCSTEYDAVIVDLPHLRQPLDAGLSRKFVTSYIAVLDWGRTGIAEVEDALQKQGLDPKSFAVAVINNVKLRRLRVYDPEGHRWLARAI